MRFHCHCEEQSDEAISIYDEIAALISFARNDELTNLDSNDVDICCNSQGSQGSDLEFDEVVASEMKQTQSYMQEIASSLTLLAMTLRVRLPRLSGSQ